jgi:hypothetical protein
MDFNLTTGQPATQADFKAFNDIVNGWKLLTKKTGWNTEQHILS